MRLVVAFAVALSSSSLAHAEKSDVVAVTLSVGVTGAGLATILAADAWGPTAAVGLGLMFVGPSTGRWYAGDAGFRGLGLRALGAGAVLLAIAPMAEGADTGSVGFALALTGVSLWLASSVADFEGAAHAARRWNLTLAPTALRTSAGDTTGLVFAGRF